MRAVLDNGTWQTRAVTDGHPMDTYKARDLMRMIAEATHVCGDPGMQFDTTINEWHTCPNSDRINASNPCSEYMFLNDSACNLASINLMKFVDAGGEFDVAGFRAAVDTLIIAQEILVDNASYPTKAIEKNSHDYRPLGLGYANLGALLMSRGLPYDGDAGRHYAAAITALMTGQAYASSARVSRDHGGPFAGYERNREPFLRVMRKHRDAMKDVNAGFVPDDLFEAGAEAWDEAVELGEEFGYRNAQTTVLAPTGTIGFMMDCDTTGIEPDIALVKYKKLVDGGLLKIVNQSVPGALTRLGYTEPQVKAIVDYIDEMETIEGAPHLREKDLPVFDCAFKPARGSRSIHHMGHIRMMGAAQPFISGAISKTVNVPRDATVEDISQAYIESWRLGVKAIAIYRDGSKRTQPLNTSRDKAPGSKAETRVVAQPVRRKLPDERQAITHKFEIAGHEGYITIGLYEDGMPGEIFLVMAKEGSTISGFADAFAQAVSYALQYGVPLQVLVDKFSHVRFEPAGMTKNPQVRIAKSIVDYVFRWLATKFLSAEAQYWAGVNGRENGASAEPADTAEQLTLPPHGHRGREEGLGVRGDPEPGGRAAVHDLRVDHGAQRQLLQVRQLRQHVAGARRTAGSRQPFSSLRAAPATSRAADERAGLRARPFLVVTDNFVWQSKPHGAPRRRRAPRGHPDADGAIRALPPHARADHALRRVGGHAGRRRGSRPRHRVAGAPSAPGGWPPPLVALAGAFAHRPAAGPAGR